MINRNILFICSGNRDRSPTAEKIYKDDESLSVRSAGTSKDAVREVTIEDVQWADIIFVMEKKHEERMITKFTRAIKYKEMHVLDIHNDYKFMDPELVKLLQTKVNAILSIN
ncbi:MAG TPA: phosphotyrosine protein phosphatase [Leptospiraceae bacterium]|nr:phosphotyrosine protein phosphatase [Leptospiraceae bacterium]HMW05252.1 phosphotyrosine protein phosphatase [Leptospiraceae bacterium]HMX31283.1 phosphotyrosine protein phosphatase [Leptospiraceae bacterium]HMY32089.1 phosphotyrosine protein phosphatase [Leptospiraceae bacterium]HMZ64694.1 phosphotyrosine protein phosphatase [Leptospiraceae bacterium]